MRALRPTVPPRVTCLALLAISAAGFLTRLWLVESADRAPELFEYDQLTRNLLSGQGYVYVHLGAPYRNFYSGILYIWFTAGLYAGFPPGHTAVLIGQSLVSSGLAVTGFFIARRLWDERAGLLAAALIVSHPALVFYDTHKLHPLSFDALLTSLAVLGLLRARDEPGSLAAGLAGGALGLAILQRGSLILLWPLGVAWLVGADLGPRVGSRWRRAAAYAVGAGLVLAAWEGGNYLRDGVAVIQSTTAEHFWVGNVAFSSGGNLLPSGASVRSAAPERFRAALGTLDARGQSSLFWRAARAHVRAHPTAFVLAIVRKFLYFWTWAPQTGVRYPRAFLLAYQAYYVGILGLAIVGAALSVHERDRRPTGWFTALAIALTCLSVSVVHSVFFVELRHRWGIEPLLLALTSVGGLEVWRWVRDRRS